MPTAAVIGGGVIGSAWASRFLLYGWDVRFYDPAANAEQILLAVLSKARRWVPQIVETLPAEGSLTICTELADAVSSADWVQESTPERIEVKHAVLRQIQTACKQAAIVGSSTSGFMPSELQEGSDRPEQILVAHPYNPVYLLPVVEVVASPLVPVEGVDRAEQILKNIGMKPIILKSEIPAHVGDRLLEAVWREALWLIKDGVATTEQIDDIMTHGFGLRWAQKDYSRPIGLRAVKPV